MKNEIFKKQVEHLFEKLAYDPHPDEIFQVAVQHHVASFNANAAKQGLTVRASYVQEGGRHVLYLKDKGQVVGKYLVHAKSDGMPSFEKVAFGFDPAQVAQRLGNDPAAGDVRRGQALVNAVPSVVKAIAGVAKGVGHVGDAVLTPAGSGVLEELRGLGSKAIQHPRMLGTALGAVALTPILAQAFTSNQKAREDELMTAYNNPGRTTVASLEDFLDKVAASGHQMYGSAMPGGPKIQDPWHQIAYEHGVEGFGKGIGQGISDKIVDLLLSGAIGGAYSKVKDVLFTEPARKKLLESVMRTDPVVSDFVKREPKAVKYVLEVYGTMVRFAPSLSLDPSAVRAFLRESILSGTIGSGVNYATIKMLVETEKEHNIASGKVKGR